MRWLMGAWPGPARKGAFLVWGIWRSVWLAQGTRRGPWPEGAWRGTWLDGDMRFFDETFQPWEICFLPQVASMAKLGFDKFFMAVAGYSWVEGEGLSAMFRACMGT